MAEAELELRILTGVHAGARAMAQSQFVIGADASCDIVLSDAGVAGRHAEIRLLGNRWTVIPLHPIDGAPPEGMELPCGARIALGRVLISLDAANAPWQAASAEEEQQAASREVLNEAAARTASDDASAIGVDGQADEETSAQAAAQAEAQAAEQAMQAAAQASSRLTWLPVHRGWRALTLALILAALLLPLAFGLRAILAPGVTASADTASGTSAAPPVRPDVLQIEAILAQPRDGASLKLEVLRNGTTRVSGFVRDEDQFIALANALSRVQPRPGLRMHNEAEISGQTLRWNNEQKREGWVLTYLGGGNFALAGSARDETQRDEMFQTVREEFPMIASLADSVRLFPDLIQELESNLRTDGFRSIDMRWIDDQMELNLSQLTPNQLIRFEEMMFRLFQETRGRLRFRVRAALAAPAAAVARVQPPVNEPANNAVNEAVNVPAVAEARPEPVLPFRIRSIAGGPAASIRLDDGRLILIGGEVDGYVLVRIDPSEIVFEGPTRISFRR